ncbi:hypothetical protein F5Y04DRAFT_277809 [Hypomontagnella monticulosa]|nr:hypothetical protein F5Y04DRAFT_277809 [Hypomontagnella monticulosa]
MAHAPVYNTETEVDVLHALRGSHWESMDIEMDEDRIEFFQTQHRKEVHELDEALAYGIDFSALKQVTPRLTGLTTIVMSSGEWREERKTPFKSIYMPFSRTIHPEGCRQLWALLESLESSSASIKTLKAESLNWMFFNEHLAIQDAFSPISDLRHIRLGISISLRNSYWDAQGCYAAMDNGVLRNVLQSLKKVEVLDIGFPVVPKFSGTRGYYCARLDQVMSTHHRWDRLTNLTLRGLKLERWDLMAILSLHKDTLRVLRLKGIMLMKSSWLPFLVWIRNTLNLDRLCIKGDLYGYVEDDTEMFYQWRQTSPGTKKSINAYCTRRSNELPLKPRQFYFPHEGPEFEWDEDLPSDEDSDWDA